ncbi:hypothetical protein BV20DRAFT_937080 [Pilatotrama ljubarskyi]|nr:hypothetical protein BV20DRAFT_937080 [Pilatotrama ljubarskyi]
MAFRTLYLPRPRDLIAPPLVLPPILGWRPPGAVFTGHEYQAYEERAFEILSQPKARSAVLSGGILWRIAMEVTSGRLEELALNGPSSDVYRWGATYRPERGDDYYDDALSELETDIVCGVYKVFTNASCRQTQDLSWWPKPNVWEKSDLHTGYWTPYCEHWFQTLLSKYRCGEEQPRNAGRWRDTLRHAKRAGKLRESIEVASANFLYNRMHIPSVRA